MKSEQNKNKPKKPIKPISTAWYRACFNEIRTQWERGRAVVKTEQTTEDEDDVILSLAR